MFYSLDSSPSCSTFLDVNNVDCPNKPGFVSLLKQCTNLAMVKLVHNRIVEAGYAEDGYLCNQLIMTYGRFGSLSDARSLFDQTTDRNIYSWNIMLSSYERNGHGADALQLFRDMDLEGIKPDNYTFVSFLTACSGVGAAIEGKAAHARIVATGFLDVDVSVGNSLINMYAKCGLVKEAEDAFESLRFKNVVTWNTMMGAYARNGYSKECLELYSRMKDESVEVSYVTFVVVLNACSTLAEGREVHSDIAGSKCQLNTTVGNALIGFYAKCESLGDSRSIFDRMQRRDVVTWNSMISAYVRCGDAARALETFKVMELRPDKVTYIAVLGACCSPAQLVEGRRLHALIKAGGFEKHSAVANSLINMYGQCGSPVEARTVFDTIPQRDIISWNALMNGLVQNGEPDAALSLYHGLQRECSPDAITFVIVLGACANCGDLKQGEEIHRRIEFSGLKDDLVIATALVTMFGKLGRLNKAKQVFDGIREPTVVAWNAMITSCVQNEQPGQALRLYHSMNVRANDITYISLVAACLSLKDLEQGKLLHQRADSDGYLVKSCLLANALIRMYGKCKCLEAATRLFNTMVTRTLSSWNSMITACVDNGEIRQALELFKQMRLRPDDVTYMTILTACRSLGDLSEGKAVHAGMSEEDERNECVATSLINMYGNCGSVPDAEVVFERMARKDTTCWTSMMVAYAQNGGGATGASLFYQMNLEGVQPDVITFSALFFCCSHSGLLERGWQYFTYMVGDFGLRATAEHYVCMVDMLSRLGWLEDAEKLVDGMPYQPDSVAWLTLLSACNVQGDSNVTRAAANAAGRAIELGSSVSAPYALLSGVYSAADR